MGEIPPVLYSADFSECAAILQLTDAEMSETFALVLRRAGATILQAYTHARARAGMEVPRADGHPSSLHQSTLTSRRA